MVERTEKETLTGVFSIIKLSKTGWSTDERILVLNDQGLTYFRVPKKSKENNTPIDTFIELYETSKQYTLDLSNNNLNSVIQSMEEVTFNELVKAYYYVKDILESPNAKYIKDNIPFEELEYIPISDIKINKKKFSYCVSLKNKGNSSSDKMQPAIYDKLNLKQGIKNEKEEKIDISSTKEWIVEFRNQAYFERFKNIIDLIKKKKIKIQIELENRKEDENATKQIKKQKDTKANLKNDAENNKELEQDPDIFHQIHYLEITYQYLLKQLFILNCNSSDSLDTRIPQYKRMQNIMRIELAIFHINQKFKDICSVIVKKMIHDLGSKPFTEGSNSFFLTPMVFPSIKLLKNPNHSVFLYYVVGLNFQLTWDKVSLKIKDGGNKTSNSDVEEVIISGAWNNLQADFKNRDFTNDLLFKIQNEFPNKIDNPRIPLSCIIDYLGFRVLCETDIFIEDGGSVCLLKKHESNSTDMEIPFFKEIALTLSNDKQIISNSINLDTMIPIQFNLREKKEAHHKHQNYGNYLKFIYKSFKEFDTLVFNDLIGKVLFSDEIEESKRNKEEENSENENDDEEKNELNKSKNNKEVDEQKINDTLNIKVKNYEYFDYCNNSSFLLKDLFKESVKYIMELKSLIEIPKEKVSEGTKKNDLNKKMIYFKPEYIFKYVAESKLLDSLESEDSNSKSKYSNLLKTYLFLENESNQPSQKINTLYKNFKDFHIYYFLNSLDSLYYLPYDSETLREAFRNYGINLYYLGLIAEITTVPHVREICLIEMIASVCKKLIFNVLSQRIMENAYSDFYTGQNEPKGFTDFDPSSGDSGYLENIPVSFFLKYNKIYLKKLHKLNNNFKVQYFIDSMKDKKKNYEGLYRYCWSKNEQFNEKEMRKLLTGNKGDDNKQGHTKEKNSYESDILNHSKKEIVKFLNVLFNFVPEKYEKFEVEILKVKYKNSSLWKLIVEQIRVNYNVQNEEILKMCTPTFMSLASLFNAIQYNTGITINLNLITNSRFPNSELINKEFSEDMIVDIKPIIKGYKYSSFRINEKIHLTSRIEFNLMYEEQQYKSSLQRFIKEKILKPQSNFSIIKMHYMNLLRKMEFISKDNMIEHLQKLDVENKEKTTIINGDYFKAHFNHHSTKFHSVFYIFLAIIEYFTNSSNNEDKNNTSVIKFSKHDEDYKTGLDYIKDYYHSLHPFICILNIIYSRLNIRTKLHFSDDVESKYKDALDVAKDALGENSLFYASLCEEVAQFYIAVNKYFLAVKLLLQANIFYSQHIEELYECYIKNLKRISKYYIVLGDYKESLNYGFDLINQFVINKQKMKFEEIKIGSFTLNMINVATELENWDKGAKLCKMLFSDIINSNKDDNIFVKYKDYKLYYKSNTYKRIENINNNNMILGTEENKEKDYEEVRLDTLLMIYMKMIFKSLTSQREVFIKSCIRLKENKNERLKLQDINEDNTELIKGIMSDLRDNGMDLEKYISVLLNNIAIKFDSTKNFKETNPLELVNNSTADKAWDKFINIYKAFHTKSDMFVVFKEY